MKEKNGAGLAGSSIYAQYFIVYKLLKLVLILPVAMIT
jgi:hypothetical protein